MTRLNTRLAWRRTLTSGFLVLTFGLWLGVSGCSTTQGGMVTIPRLPVWKNSERPPLTGSDLRNEIYQVAPEAAVILDDVTYTHVAKSWLVDYLNWCWNAAKADDITYTPESFDCDDFALGFRFFASRSAARSGLHVSVAVAQIIVILPNGLYHALNLVFTDEGAFVVEPQPDAGPFRTTPIKDYSNPIVRVEL